MSKSRPNSKLHMNSSDEVLKFFTAEFDGETRVLCRPHDSAGVTFRMTQAAMREFGSGKPDDTRSPKKFYGRIHSVLETSDGIFLKIVADRAIVKIWDRSGQRRTQFGRCVTIIPLNLVENVYTVLLEKSGAGIQAAKQEDKPEIELPSEAEDATDGEDESGS